MHQKVERNSLDLFESLDLPRCRCLHNGTSPIQQLLRCDSSAPVSPKVLVVLKCHSNHVWQNAGTPIMDSQSVHPCDTPVLLKPLNTFVSKTSAEEFLVVPFCSILKKVDLKSMPKCVESNESQHPEVRKTTFWRTSDDSRKLCREKL